MEDVVLNINRTILVFNRVRVSNPHRLTYTQILVENLPGRGLRTEYIVSKGSIGYLREKIIISWESTLVCYIFLNLYLLSFQKRQFFSVLPHSTLDLPTSRAQSFSRTRSASGTFFMFSAAKASWSQLPEPEMRSEGL